MSQWHILGVNATARFLTIFCALVFQHFGCLGEKVLINLMSSLESRVALDNLFAKRGGSKRGGYGYTRLCCLEGCTWIVTGIAYNKLYGFVAYPIVHVKISSDQNTVYLWATVCSICR